jgi:hypothetical protein
MKIKRPIDKKQFLGPRERPRGQKPVYQLIALFLRIVVLNSLKTVRVITEYNEKTNQLGTRVTI